MFDGRALGPWFPDADATGPSFARYQLDPDAAADRVLSAPPHAAWR
jgi:hypothetical protein